MAKPLTLNLTVGERLYLINALNGAKSSLNVLAVIMEDLKLLNISDEEWEKAERKIVLAGDSNQWIWNEEKGGLKEVTLQSESVDAVSKIIKDKNQAKDFTFADRTLLTLAPKLDIDLSPKE